MKALSNPRSIGTIADEIREHVLEQQSIARMMRAVFYEAGDRHSQLRAFADDLWEGLAAIARLTERDCSAISQMVDELQSHVDMNPASRNEGHCRF